MGAWLVASGCVYYTRPKTDAPALLARRAAADEQVRATTQDFIDKVLTRTKSHYDDFKAGKTKSPPTIDILIISGGGDWGAFGAGFLKGWCSVPADDLLAKPDFDVVTGVSTGSLIAPFAYLGDEASIDQVVHLYRNPKKDWVRQRGYLYFLPHNISFAQIPGLEKELRTIVTPEFVRRIADASSSGRLLAVNTTNVDDGGPHVFDVGAEARAATRAAAAAAAAAAATQPAKKKKEVKKDELSRVQNILLASSGIPGAFPFRIIDGEMYVDGGVTGNIIYGGRISEADSLTAQWASRYPDIPLPKTRYWVIFNNWIRPHPQLTAPNWPAVVQRSLEMGTRAATVTAMRHLYAMAEISRLKHNAEVEIRIVSVPEDWTPPKPGVFIKETMNDLVDIGERMGADTKSWSTTPP
jgi:hypothetical protein